MTVWQCPNCAKKSILIKIQKSKSLANISCGNCGLSLDILVNRISEPIDVYGDFIDQYYNKKPEEINAVERGNRTNEILITEQKILGSLINNWKNLVQLQEDLQILNELDKRFLKIKLVKLLKNNEIKTKKVGEEIYWMRNG